jgi:hypothetical protein
VWSYNTKFKPIEDMHAVKSNWNVKQCTFGVGAEMSVLENTTQDFQTKDPTKYGFHVSMPHPPTLFSLTL